MNSRFLGARGGIDSGAQLFGLLFVIVSVLFGMRDSRADQDDTVEFSLGHSFRYTDNLFRMSDGVRPNIGGKTSRDDMYQSSALGFVLHKPYSLQKFELQGTLTAFRYQNYSFLNYETFNYRGAWLWQVTPRITGTLSTSREQSVASFSDYRNFGVRNIITNESQNLEANWNVFGGHYAFTSISHSINLNSQSFSEQPSYVGDSARVGYRYAFSSGSSVQLSSGRSVADLPTTRLNPFSQTDNHFESRDAEMRLSWIATGKSTLSANLRRASRDYPHYPSRDFSGMSGSVTWNWSPTGKLRVEAGLAQDVDGWTANYASSRQVRRAYLSPSWQVSAKTVLSMQVLGSQERYLGPITPGPLREDRLSSVSAMLQWSPWRGISLNGSVQKDRRNSSFPGLQFDAIGVGISARIRF